MNLFQQECLILAKKSILEEFWKDNLNNFIPSDKKLFEQKSCFVTLRKAWNLRWCIWSILAHQELYKDIISNAKSAAFNDPRFSSLTFEEIEKWDMFLDITVLSPLEKINFNSIEELLKYLWENRPWLIIKLWLKQATFLPSVWKELNNPEDFLIHLIYKAEINPEDFKDNFNKVEISVYSGEEFGEELKIIKK